MTTIACNLREMAADSKIGEEDLAGNWYRGDKLHRINGSIFGEAGDTDEVPLVYAWMRAGSNLLDRPTLSLKADFLLLELSAEGIFVWTKHVTRTKISARHAAIGSGGPIALYCMRHRRMSPVQAVREAARIDDATGGPFKSLRVSQ